MKTVPLVGYSDKLSGRPGERINFMVSSEHKGDFTAELFRSISADPNPQGLGVVEQSCDEFFPKKSFLSRKQAFHPGSYAISCLLYTSPSPRDRVLSRMPSSA